MTREEAYEKQNLLIEQHHDLVIKMFTKGLDGRETEVLNLIKEEMDRISEIINPEFTASINQRLKELDP